MTFLAVAEAGSVTAAAGRLGRSKSAVSKAVSALEDRYKTRLFQRTTRRLSLTEAGASLFEHCQRLQSEIAAAEESLTRHRAAPAGHLRLSAPMSFGQRHLPKVLAGFMERYPDITVELTLNDRQVDLVEEGFDLAVRVGDLKDSSLIARRFATTRFQCCAAPSYLRAHGVPAHPRELSGHRCLVYSYGRPFAQWRFLDNGRPLSVVVKPAMVANNGDALARIAAAGEGIVVTPDFITADAVRAGGLTPILEDFSGVELGINALHAAGRLPPVKVRAFIDYVISAFRGVCWSSPG